MTHSQKRITTKEGNTFRRRILFENMFPPYHRGRPVVCCCRPWIPLQISGWWMKEMLSMTFLTWSWLDWLEIHWLHWETSQLQCWVKSWSRRVASLCHRSKARVFLGGKVHGLKKLGEWNGVDDVGGVIWMFLQQVSSVQEFGGQSKSSPVDIHLASFLCGSRLLSLLQGFIWANSWIDLHQLLPTCTSARNAISQAPKEFERMIVRIHEGFFRRWYTYYSWWCSTWYGKNTWFFLRYWTDGCFDTCLKWYKMVCMDSISDVSEICKNCVGVFLSTQQVSEWPELLWPDWWTHLAWKSLESMYPSFLLRRVKKGDLLKPGASLTLHYGSMPIVFSQTLQQQGIHREATLTSTWQVKHRDRSLESYFLFFVGKGFF